MALRICVILHIIWSLIHIQLFRERLAKKVHATIPKGIVGGFKFTVLQRNLKELARKTMQMCLRVLKESNKSRFDSYSRQEQCIIDHIPYYLSGLSRVHFSDNLFRNSCIYTSYSYRQVPTSKDFTYTRTLLNLFRNVMKYSNWWKIDWA